MTVPANTNTLLLNSAAPAAYQISRSLRFNSADSAYLNRTPGSAGSRTTWTWSGWVKRGKFVGDEQTLFAASTSSPNNQTVLYLSGTEKLDFRCVDGSSLTARIVTTAVYRDTGAWMHVVLAVDTTQATASNRFKLYVNGSQVTALDTATYPSQNYNTHVNNTIAHSLGLNSPFPAYPFDGYLADIYFLDGTATTPSTFAETDAITGQWVPKTPTGISYGTNGFRLTFSDNSGTTSTTLGKDAAGSNNWTPNNFSVASGSGNDSLVDSPTSYGTDTGAGGEVRGNYATLNPLDNGGLTLANGNLDYSRASNSWLSCRGTIGVSAGKWYWEATFTSVTFAYIGVGKNSMSLADSVGASPDGWAYSAVDGKKYNNATSATYGATFTSGDTIGVAFDADNGTLTFYKNGSSQGQAYSGLTSGPYFPAFSLYGTASAVANFGQRAFAYTAPSGFKALVDTNLTAPTIAKPADQFGILLWTGNTTNGNGSRAISGLNFQPEFVWIKARSASVYGHLLFDAVRGAANSLASESTAIEGTPAANGKLDSFDSTGFTVNNGTSNGWYVNTNGESYVGWCWNAASSNSTNTQGSITSTVRANAAAGLSIVAWNGNGNATVGHGLGVPPQLIICKKRGGATSDWQVGHASLGWTKRLALNQATGEETTVSAWNNTAPTSTVFSIGNTSNFGGDIISYCFAPVAGYSAFGSYTGNGSSDGPFVFTGFNPRWLMVKAYANLPFSGTYAYWFIYDSARDLLVNPTDLALAANVQDQEFATYYFDFLSNGFKVRTNAVWVNGSNTSFLWAAFAENPFQYARAR